jgi:hypothetical protein
VSSPGPARSRARPGYSSRRDGRQEPRGGAGPPAAAARRAATSGPGHRLWVAGQQIWLGPAMSGRTIRLWAGLDRVHVLMDGYRVKTLPSRLDARDLARLAAGGARPAGPPPLPPAAGDAVEVERTGKRLRQRQPPQSCAQRRAAAGRAAGDTAAGRPGRPHRVRRRPGPHRRLPRPASGLVPAARGPRRNSPAAAAARTARGHPAGLRARGDHGRRAEDPGRPGPRPQDRRSHRGSRHLPGHRRARHHHHRAPAPSAGTSDGTRHRTTATLRSHEAPCAGVRSRPIRVSR